MLSACDDDYVNLWEVTSELRSNPELSAVSDETFVAELLDLYARGLVEFAWQRGFPSVYTRIDDAEVRRLVTSHEVWRTVEHEFVVLATEAGRDLYQSSPWPWPDTDTP